MSQEIVLAKQGIHDGVPVQKRQHTEAEARSGYKGETLHKQVGMVLGKPKLN